MKVLSRRSASSRRGWELEPLTGTRRPDATVTIGVLVYRGVTTSEVESPAVRLAERLNADVVHVGRALGPVPGVEPARPVNVDAVPDVAMRPELLVVPGGLGWKNVVADTTLTTWLGHAARSARGILAISTGSLLLASTGALDGIDATGHWLAEDQLADLGAQVRSDRIARDDAGRLVTASGTLAALQAVDDLADRVAWSAP